MLQNCKECTFHFTYLFHISLNSKIATNKSRRIKLGFLSTSYKYSIFFSLDSDTITGHCHGVFISFSCGRSKYIPKVNFSCLVAFWTSMMMNCQVVHAKRTCRTLEVVCAQLHTMKISKKDQQT